MKALGPGSVSSFLTIVLNVAWYGVAIILALTVILAAVGANVAVHIDPNGLPSVEGAGPGVRMAIPVTLHLDAGTHRVTAPSLGIGDALVEGAHGTLRFPPQKGTLSLINLALVIGLLSLTLWVLGQLRAIFRTLRERRPFVPANALRIARIAWAVIAGEVARAAVVYFENYYAMTHFHAAGMQFDARPELNLFVIFHGLIILVIAAVFRMGTRLDEDQSLTI